VLIAGLPSPQERPSHLVSVPSEAMATSNDGEKDAHRIRLLELWVIRQSRLQEG
jgi:hypothetical protein